MHYQLAAQVKGSTFCWIRTKDYVITSTEVVCIGSCWRRLIKSEGSWWRAECYISHTWNFVKQATLYDGSSHYK